MRVLQQTLASILGLALLSACGGGSNPQNVGSSTAAADGALISDPIPSTPGSGQQRRGQWFDQYIPSESGETIAFTVYEPREFVGGQRYPVVLHGHGYGGSRQQGPQDPNEDPDGFIGELYRNNYVVVSFDQRGFGESSGEVGMMSPDLDGVDKLTLLDWLEENLDYLLYRDEGNGPNLVVGGIGGSYGGGWQFLTHNQDPEQRLDALTPDITWYDLSYSLHPNGIYKSSWSTLLLAGGEAGSGGNQNLQQRQALADVATINEFRQSFLDSLYENSPRAWCERNMARPGNILITQGHVDALFNFTESWQNYQCFNGLPGSDVRLIGHHQGHILPSQSQSGSRACGSLDFNAIRLAWLNEKLKDMQGAADFVPELCITYSEGDDFVVPRGQTIGNADFVVGNPGNGVTITSTAVTFPAAHQETNPVNIPLLTASGTQFLRGFPVLNIDITSAVPAPTDDSRLWFGLSVQRGGIGDLIHIDEQWTPVRGYKSAERIEMVAIAERLEAGDILYLTINTGNDQYATAITRFPPAAGATVNVSGDIELPLQ